MNSPRTVASDRPSGLKVTRQVACVGPCTNAFTDRSATFYSQTCPVLVPAASIRSSGLNATLWI